MIWHRAPLESDAELMIHLQVGTRDARIRARNRSAACAFSAVRASLASFPPESHFNAAQASMDGTKINDAKLVVDSRWLTQFRHEVKQVNDDDCRAAPDAGVKISQTKHRKQRSSKRACDPFHVSQTRTLNLPSNS